MNEFLLVGDFTTEIMRACGVVGSIVYVGGFALVQAGRVCGNGHAYVFSKIIAAILVLISLVAEFNLGSFLIQVGFLAIGLWGLARRPIREASVTSLTPAE